MKIKSFMAISLLLVCLLSACASSSGATPSPTAITQPSIAEALPNSEYLIDCTSSGKAQLKDGSFEEPAAPGSASVIKVRLDQQSFGDIDGDGLEDAAVTLIADTGGSGTFTYLALVANDNGTARPLPAVLLGDRIEVKSLTIQSGTITVAFLTRKPDEAMAAQPTVEATLKFALRGGKLVEVQ